MSSWINGDTIYQDWNTGSRTDLVQRNEEPNFELCNFEMSNRPSSGDAEQVAGWRSLGLRGEV